MDNNVTIVEDKENIGIDVGELNAKNALLLNEFLKKIKRDDLFKSNEQDRETTLNNEIEHFKDKRVWVTKKIRMESEARMNKNNIFSLFMVNFYTLIVLSLSIIALVINDSVIVNKITVLTLISSVALFGVSLFVSLYGFKEKALSYKQCYLDLTKIENDFQSLLLKNQEYEVKESNFNDLKKDYANILEKTDNHSRIDRLIYLKNNDKLETLELNLSYWYLKIKWFFVKSIIFIIPFIIISLIFIWK
ncbi:SLATT domain-containing protein [uncultured Exiguobacterium sp.]|uniref:SLATT domain-containing protein n=1 Tax=uncultured Exiguobacterium sp. TaxID=202669 RepID=UPI003747F2C6